MVKKVKPTPVTTIPSHLSQHDRTVALDNKVKLTIMVARSAVEREFRNSDDNMTETQFILKTMCLTKVGKMMFDQWKDWSEKAK